MNVAKTRSRGEKVGFQSPPGAIFDSFHDLWTLAETFSFEDEKDYKYEIWLFFKVFSRIPK